MLVEYMWGILQTPTTVPWHISMPSQTITYPTDYVHKSSPLVPPIQVPPRSTMLSTLLIILFLAASLLFYKRSQNNPPKGLLTPPAPKGLPLLGNAHQLGPHPHRQIIKWARAHGEIYRIRLGWNDWYMLCSPEAVKEIMDRQSKDSSSRAPMPVASQALSGGLRFLFMEYGAEWRRLRAFSHRYVN